MRDIYFGGGGGGGLINTDWVGGGGGGYFGWYLFCEWGLMEGCVLKVIVFIVGI